MSETILHDGFFKFVMVTRSDGRTREFLRTTDSAYLLVYDVDNKNILLVRQPREAMIAVGNPEGLIDECIGGRFDVNLSPRELMAKEAKEEFGLTIDPETIELLNNGQPMAVSAGAVTEKAYLGIAQVFGHQVDMTTIKSYWGNETEGERITRIFVSRKNLEEYVCEDVRVFALIQYLLRKLQQSA